MKKVLIILGLSLLLGSCNNNTEKIKRIEWYQIGEAILISKNYQGDEPLASRYAYAYVKRLEDKRIYFVDLPKQIYNDYFKDAQKGDTIRL